MNRESAHHGSARGCFFHLVLPVFLMILSITVAAPNFSKLPFMQSSLEAVDDSNEKVMTFAAATTTAAIAVSMLPGDTGSPISESFGEMSKYFVLILIALFVERMILASGVGLMFSVFIPIGLLLCVIGHFFRTRPFQVFGSKILILAVAIIFVVPVSVYGTKFVGSSYLEYVDTTISETGDGAEAVQEQASEDGDTSIFDKISDAVGSLVDGASGLMDYFKNLMKKCMNSIAILIVTNFVMPIITLLLLRWILKELFNLGNMLAVPQEMRRIEKHDTDEKKEDL